MKRVKRLQPLVSLATQTEREHASRLVEAERRLAEASQRLEELIRFRQEYERAFHDRATSGTEMRSLRESRLFIACLDDAVRAQEHQMDELRGRVSAEREQWGAAATRKQVVAKVVERATVEATSREARFLQRELDERAAQRSVPR